METAEELQRLKPYSDFLVLVRVGYSRTAYTQALRYFKKFLDERRKSPATATREDLLEFYKSLSRPGETPAGRPRAPLGTSTIIHSLGAVRQFYRYLGAMGKIKNDPSLILHFVKLKRPERLPRALTLEQREALVGALRTGKRWELEISLAVLFGYHCGLRRSEIAGLEVKKINLFSHTVSVIGKGDKERAIPASGDVADLFRRWMKSRKHEKSPFVFPCIRNSDRQHVKPQVINGWMKKAADWAGLEDLTVHVLRHSFGTQLAENGATPYEIRDLMGHSNILTGETYVKLASEAARRAHDRAFRKESFNGGSRQIRA